jgi:molybdopterin-containing oxidoreductase family iron-sulfur binding subunit
MSRLYVVESTRTITGGSADHRLAIRPSRIPEVAQAVGQMLGAGGALPGELPEAARRFVQAAGEDLKKHAGSSLVVVGESQPPEVHALGHAMNAALGNVGKTVTYIRPPQANPVGQRESLRELIDDLDSGETRTLLILGGNPVYTAPADTKFAAALTRFSKRTDPQGAFERFSAHLSLYDDETSELCQWALPLSHYLESWGDVRAFDGTASVVQPLIYPLYKSRSALEVLSGIVGSGPAEGYDLVRAYWQGQSKSEAFDDDWQVILEAGVVEGTAYEAVNEQRPSLGIDDLKFQNRQAADGELEIIFRPDSSVWDGAFGNLSWMQELPKQMMKLTWDNAVVMSMATAEKLKLSHPGHPYKANEKLVRLQYRGRTINAPVWVLPGHADDCVTVYLGYGRWRGGALATGYDVGGQRGYNAYLLRMSEHAWWDGGLTILPTDGRTMLAGTQGHQAMQTADTRDLTLRGTVSQVNTDPRKVVKPRSIPLSLYEPAPYDYDKRPYEWAMSIDNTACIGCNACVVACQAENNIPTVGKEQVLKGREMHWLRIDTWFDETADEVGGSGTYFEPIPCMQCELAPCEAVCPVLATTHSIEGINEMTYNRCIGTRYCSNNCPYKVRRFNFLQWQDQVTGSLMLQRNPDVSVRTRGVMEKCNYCIQRINEARIDCEKEGRTIRDGEIQTACQQACPTQAIIFGNKNDEASQVSKLRSQPLNFYLLEELNTRPRTSYLPRVSNPNEAL